MSTVPQKKYPKIDLAAAKARICAVLSTPKVVVERLGLRGEPDGDAVLTHCPGRGHLEGDKKPSLRFRTVEESGRVAAHCFPCHWHGGSVIDIVAAVKLDMWGDLKGADYLRALEAAAQIAGVDLDQFVVGRGRPRKAMPDEVRAELAEVRQRALPLSSVPSGRTEPYWHAEVADYLRSRGLDPVKLDALRYGGGDTPETRLVGCLSDDVYSAGNRVFGVLSRREGSWDQTGHRLILPLFSAGGRLAGLIGRATNGSDKPKSLGATGVKPEGSVMCNALGKMALAARDRLTERWTAARESKPSLPEYPKVFIAEGEIDFLTVLQHAETESAIVLGVKSESWDATIAGCVPTQSEVYILTHSDDPGCKYRDTIAKTLTGRKIFVRHAGQFCQKKPDENDMLRADPVGYSPSVGCAPYEAAAEPEPEGKGGKEPALADQLLALAVKAEPELIIDSSTGDPYLVVTDGPVTTAIPALGEDAYHWVHGIWDDANPTRTLRKNDVTAVLDKLASRALRKGKRGGVHRRVGRAGTEGSVYLDLCDGSGEALEIDDRGWRAVAKPRCCFARPSVQKPLPRPQKVPQAEKLAIWEKFFSLVRVTSDRRTQIVGWLLSTMLPTGPYPLVVFGGEQGSAKSTSSRILCSVVDPSVVRKRKQPKDDEAMTVAAKYSHVLDYDNLSSVPGWMSDLLCQFSTGGSDSKRKLFTDDGQKVVTFLRPVVLTGIPDLATRGDLLDRSIVVHLEPIAPSDRRSEKEIDAEWEEIHPKVLGILCDGIAAFLRNGPAKLDNTPRLADFYALAEAGVEACGFPPGSVVGAYAATQGDRELATLDGDPTFVALDAMLDPDVIQDGENPLDEAPTSPMLLGRMCDILERVRKLSRPDAKIPQSGNGLESWMRRHGSALRAAGIHCAAASRSSRGQLWRVWRGGPTPPTDAQISG